MLEKVSKKWCSHVSVVNIESQKTYVTTLTWYHFWEIDFKILLLVGGWLGGRRVGCQASGLAGLESHKQMRGDEEAFLPFHFWEELSTNTIPVSAAALKHCVVCILYGRLVSFSGRLCLSKFFWVNRKNLNHYLNMQTCPSDIFNFCFVHLSG